MGRVDKCGMLGWMPDADAVRVTFVTWDAETDGVALKINGEVVWRERSWDSLSQAPLPLGVPVILDKEVVE